MITFKSELLAEDLPTRDTVSLREAACWLSGLPVGDLDDPVRSTPRERSKVQIGRSQKSGQFWYVVMAHLATRDQGPVIKFPWHELSFQSGREFQHSRTERAARRLIDTARAYCSQLSATPHELVERWKPVLKFEVERIWAVREALLQIARRLEELIDGHQTDVLADIQTREVGFRISLRTTSLYELTDAKSRGTQGIELWTRNRASEQRVERIKDLRLSRDRLVELFIRRPDAERDSWINENRAQAYWPINLLLGVLKYDGDWPKLWELWNKLSAMGVQPVFDVTSAHDTSEPGSGSLGVDAGREAEWLEAQFREGTFEALAVREGSSRHEIVPSSEWTFLKLRQEQRPQRISVRDASGVTTIKFEHPVITGNAAENILEAYRAASTARGVVTPPDAEEDIANSDAMTAEFLDVGTNEKSPQFHSIATEKRAVIFLRNHIKSLNKEEFSKFDKAGQRRWLEGVIKGIGSRAFARIRIETLEGLSDKQRQSLQRSGRRSKNRNADSKHQ